MARIFKIQWEQIVRGVAEIKARTRDEAEELFQACPEKYVDLDRESDEDGRQKSNAQRQTARCEN